MSRRHARYQSEEIGPFFAQLSELNETFYQFYGEGGVVKFINISALRKSLRKHPITHILDMPFDKNDCAAMT